MESSYRIPVRVTAHGCRNREQASMVLRSFLAETERSATRHELVIRETDGPRDAPTFFLGIAAGVPVGALVLGLALVLAGAWV